MHIMSAKEKHSRGGATGRVIELARKAIAGLVRMQILVVGRIARFVGISSSTGSPFCRVLVCFVDVALEFLPRARKVVECAALRSCRTYLVLCAAGAHMDDYRSIAHRVLEAVHTQVRSPHALFTRFALIASFAIRRRLPKSLSTFILILSKSCRFEVLCLFRLRSLAL